MKCTNKDLDRLKWRNPSHGSGGSLLVESEQLEALIYRLECAEKALKRLDGYYVCQTYGCPNDGYDRATECDHDKRVELEVKEWKKARGRE